MINKAPFKQPEFKETAFNCTFCNAFANQTWHQLFYYSEQALLPLEVLYISICFHCERYSIWFDEKMIHPDFQGVESPNVDLSEEVKEDYSEASSILQKSPRGAAALLRLAIQKLCIQLGENGQDLNTDIGNLVKKGLPVKVQQSLDSLRVIGNESVHPGQLDLKDDIETAATLFRLINFIGEKMITEPKEIDEIYNKLPESKKKQIEERDKKVA